MSSNDSGDNFLQKDEIIEKTGFQRLIADLKQHFFMVLFTLMKDQKQFPLFIYVILICFKFAQMFYFPFHKDVY